MSKLQTLAGIAVTIIFVVMLVLAVTEQPTWQLDSNGIPVEVSAR